MKNSILKLKYFVLLSSFIVIACSKDGAVGPAGPQGEQGIQGNPGQDGEDGTDGQDGENGNANVQTYIFDTSTYDFGGLNYLLIEFPELTEGVLKNDAILFFIRRTDAFDVDGQQISAYYPIPSKSLNHLIEVEMGVGGFYVVFYDNSTNAPVTDLYEGQYDLVKVVVIESSNTQTLGKNTKTEWFSKLKMEGVDINNYQQVMNYFGLED
ncbi:collagen-like protein [Flagellimonas pacifica]|nr:collagen-like protein [Allomuricauda parva]